MDNNPDLPSYSTIQVHFGCLSNVFIELNYNPIRTNYTKEEIKGMMEVFYNNNKRIPKFDEYTYDNDLPSIRQIYRKFGGVEKCYQEIYGLDFKIPTVYGYMYKSNHNDIRPSIIDGKIDDLLGENGVNHSHEIPYKNFIPGFNREFVVDYKIDDAFIIEVAGFITEKEFLNISKIKSKRKKEYALNLNEKIEYLKTFNSNIKLIVIFKKDSKEKIRKLLEPVYSYAKENNHYPYELNTPKTLSDKNLNYKPNKRVYSDEYLLNNIITRYEELGKMPFLSQMDKDCWPYPSIYTKRKKWSDWKKEAEMELNNIINKK